jgi:hypothetical protein
MQTVPQTLDVLIHRLPLGQQIDMILIE